MKKNVLALSIAALGLSLAGGAHAITNAPTGAGTASDLRVGNSGTGHMAVIPYYTTQAGNSTLISIVNTDTVNGKAVKVRFRGAANSDDVFDFQVFLSPSDVWTANVSGNGSGVSYLTTTDTSCTKPARNVLNTTPFVMSRLNPNATPDERAAGTREGYVEIFAMANIPSSTTGVYPLIKHPANGAPKCANDGANISWTAINADTTTAGYTTLGLTAPTTGLLANWTVINVPKAVSWSGAATAIEAYNTDTGNVTTGNMVYFPQVNAPLAAGSPILSTFTSDPLLVSTRVTAGQYDLPDMSTPYTLAAETTTGFTTPAQRQAASLTEAIAATGVINEYVTDPFITAQTDWVFSMPTRRYWAAVDYVGNVTSNGRIPQAIYANATATDVGTGVGQYFTPANVTLNARNQLCIRGITFAGTTFDREENSPSSPDDVVISPSQPGEALNFCGEASVISFNNNGATTTAVLGAQVAVTDLDVPYNDGWMLLNTPGAVAAAGLPILGQSFVSAFNPDVGDGVSGNFGLGWAHRFVRPVATGGGE